MLPRSKAISYTVGFRQSKTALFDWILLVLLLIVRLVDFIALVLFREAVGAREYCCMAAEYRLAALCFARFLREQRLDEPSSQRVGGFGLSRMPPRLLSWSCTQPGAAKATAGAAVVGSMGSIPRALPSCDTRCWRAELGMRHADLLREATNSSHSQASVSAWMILLCGTWYGYMAVWPCGCVFGGGMSDAIG